MDEYYIMDGLTSRLLRCLENFAEIIYSPFFRSSIVILFFTFPQKFRQKLSKYPLKNYIPSYKNGDEFSFIQKLFVDCLKKSQYINYFQLDETNRQDNMSIFMSCSREMIITNNFRALGLGNF